MIILERTTIDDSRFRSLVIELDADLRRRYGPKQSQYDPHNRLAADAAVIVALEGENPLGCGCFRRFSERNTIEIKRMYTQPHGRNQGVAQRILVELEAWAKQEGYLIARLETGIAQSEAIRLYEKTGYRRIPNYGPYVNNYDSLCYEKSLL